MRYEKYNLFMRFWFKISNLYYRIIYGMFPLEFQDGEGNRTITILATDGGYYKYLYNRFMEKYSKKIVKTILTILGVIFLVCWGIISNFESIRAFYNFIVGHFP